MYKYYRTALLLFICLVLFTLTGVVPLGLLKGYYFLLQAAEALGGSVVVRSSYVLLYLVSFAVLFRFTRSAVFGLALFSFIHYAILTTLLYVTFANNDGQAILLVFVDGIVSSVLVFPIASVWGVRPEK